MPKLLHFSIFLVNNNHAVGAPQSKIHFGTYPKVVGTTLTVLLEERSQLLNRQSFVLHLSLLHFARVSPIYASLSINLSGTFLHLFEIVRRQPLDVVGLALLLDERTTRITDSSYLSFLDAEGVGDDWIAASVAE